MSHLIWVYSVRKGIEGHIYSMEEKVLYDCFLLVLCFIMFFNQCTFRLQKMTLYDQLHVYVFFLIFKHSCSFHRLINIFV